MSLAIVTGSSGLVGSAMVGLLHDHGFDIVGFDNDLRAYFFGPEASVASNTRRLTSQFPRFHHEPIDIRDGAAVEAILSKYGRAIDLVVHCAAQPSHDWAARDPTTDFAVNAGATLGLLEAVRKAAPDAVFIFTSTNKVYGDTPNALPLIEMETRWEVDPTHPWSGHGIDETMSIDQTKHSVFGASKLAADVLVQEYGRYFGMRTGVFRGGCLTGPAHAGAELHGFLAYLVHCAVSRRPYTIFGHKGKQVRDNIHASDLVQCFWHFYRDPIPGAVYNIGGSRHSNCSVLEAIALIEEIGGVPVEYTVNDTPRVGDHIWWISDVRKFQTAYPAWSYSYDLRRTLQELIAAAQDRLRNASTARPTAG